jgi:hypothetical protein
VSRAGIFLLALGLLQMAGDVLHVPLLKGIAAAAGASPAPKVFSSVRGLETFSTRFFIEWTDSAGTFHSLEITPQLYARVRGPYNRRNVYGALLAYGPVLQTDERTLAMFNSVARYGLCNGAPLLHDLGIEPAKMRGSVVIRLQPRANTNTENLPLLISAPCQ